MKHTTLRMALTLLAASTLLGGCETVSSWFPDKQKQYKFSSDIPPLEIPPDLSSSTIEDVANPAPTDRGVLVSDETPAQQAPSASAAEAPAPEPARSSQTSVLGQNSANVPLVEIEAPFDLAWAEVAKALGRMEVEVSDQNRSDGVFYVYYGGDKAATNDRGFFGDVADMFSGGAAKSKEYRVKLEQRGKATAVTVLDSESKPQFEGPGFELLKELHQTLQTQAAPGKGGEAEPKS